MGCSSTHKKKKLFHSIDVDQFLGSVKATLGSLLERYTGAEITDKLGSSILATLFRQQVLHSYCDLNGFGFVVFVFFLRDYSLDYNISCGPWQMILLLELCFLDIPHSLLLKSFSSLVELLRGLSTDTGDIFSKVCQLTEFTTWHTLCENASNIASYRTMYPCIRLRVVVWVRSLLSEGFQGFLWNVIMRQWRHHSMILHCRYDLFQLKDPPATFSQWLQMFC